ncbi:MAG TPA: histone-like nucleoid-structuring protein Lsr2 [Streptosporangiaceae bacterium]|nr:histone-like nucleoid-structuring protein Lsr2 [Streptosporangiaceae bacterium]
MAPSVTATLTDDTGQPDASETVCFGVDGRAYEIDLSARHASELRSMAGRYISAARRVRAAPSRARQQPQARTRTPTDREQSRRPGADQDEPAAPETVAAAEAGVRGRERGLTDREQQELRTIADAARPLRNIVAGRLRTKGLADRDSAGTWWLTEAGRRELMSA